MNELPKIRECFLVNVAIPKGRHIMDDRPGDAGRASRPVEMRRHARYAVSWKVMLRESDVGGAVLPGRACDISLGGLSLLSELPTSATRVTVAIAVPGTILKIDGVVVYCTFSPRDGQYRVGIQFVDVPAREVDLLRRVLAERIPLTS